MQSILHSQHKGCTKLNINYITYVQHTHKHILNAHHLGSCTRFPCRQRSKCHIHLWSQGKQVSLATDDPLKRVQQKQLNNARTENSICDLIKRTPPGHTCNCSHVTDHEWRCPHPTEREGTAINQPNRVSVHTHSNTDS